MMGAMNQVKAFYVIRSAENLAARFVRATRVVIFPHQIEHECLQKSILDTNEK